MHLKKHRNGNLRPRLNCPHASCGKSFSQKTTYHQHLSTHSLHEQGGNVMLHACLLNGTETSVHIMEHGTLFLQIVKSKFITVFIVVTETDAFSNALQVVSTATGV